MLLKRYQKAINELLKQVSTTQNDAIIRAGELVAKAAENNKKIYLDHIVHGIEHDLIHRGGGPVFYLEYKPEETELQPGDILFVSSVSGRTLSVVERTVQAMEKGVTVIAFTSMAYATQVEPVHESGKKLYELATLTLDNCAPPAEAMLKVNGIGSRFAAASGISSAFILWSVTAVAVEKMIQDGCPPGIFASINYPGGEEYNETQLKPHYEKFGW